MLLVGVRKGETTATATVSASRASFANKSHPLESIGGEDAQDEDHANGRTELLIPSIINTSVWLTWFVPGLLDRGRDQKSKSETDALVSENAEEFNLAVHGNCGDSKIEDGLGQKVGNYSIEEEHN